MKHDLAGKSVFLTGGTGFLGTHLRQELRERAADVTVLSTAPATVFTFEDETVVEGDLTDNPPTIGEYDIVVHLAARTSVDASITDPKRTWEVNATGTLNMLERIRQDDIERLLLVSTASVYGAPKYLPIDEEHSMAPREPYGASKAAADRLTASYVHAYDTPAVIARPFNVFGPEQPRYNVVGEIIEQAQAGGQVELGNLSPNRDFSYVADVVGGLLRVLGDGTAGEAYNIGSGDSVSIRELAETIVSFFDRDIEIASVDAKRRQSSVEIEDHRADISKLAALGWSPEYSLRAGLRHTVEEW